MNAREAALERDRLARLRLGDRLALDASEGRSGPEWRMKNAQRSLTRRELEVLRLVADGDTNDEAATTLGLSVETVKQHMKNTIDKLDARNRTHATALALRHGLIT